MTDKLTITYDTVDRVWSIRHDDNLLVDISFKDERVFFNKALDIEGGYFMKDVDADMEIVYNIFHITLSIVVYYTGAANQSDYFDNVFSRVQEALQDIYDDWTDFTFDQLTVR